jgi:hypothetical protein
VPGVRNVELVLVAALVLAAPSLIQAFGGGISLTTALLRLTAAIALCWAGGAIVERVLDTYSRESRRREIERHLTTLAEARARLAQQARAEGEQR